jgi:hypothetical protein
MRRALLGALALAALALAASGCTDSLRVCLFTREHGPLVTESAFQPAVQEAAAILGHDVVLTREQKGAVIVEILDVDSPEFAFEGRSLLNLDGRGRLPRCYRAVWVATDDPRVLAHELGHALGLVHTDASGNVMNPDEGPDATDLTDDQQETVDREVTRLGRC